jgi:hypothetical protein
MLRRISLRDKEMRYKPFGRYHGLHMKIRAFVLSLAACASVLSTSSQGQERWSAEKANAWYAAQPWLVGANYVPSDAINQFEMFQATTFDPPINDRELGLAESIGMNTMRVFLQDQLWQQDPKGFVKRLDAFLTIASKHHIRPILVLFDSCWEADPHPGPQHPPIPGVHNSGWVQSPGGAELSNPAYEPRLKEYVVGVVSAFAKDDRILAWDIWNEPDNTNGDRFKEPKNKRELVAAMLPKAFAWARSAQPTQPLTSGVWQDQWSDLSKLNPVEKVQLSESDIITFHNYGWPEDFEARVKDLQALHRPIICTEYMARGAGSTFDTILPLAKQLNVGAINWGLVAGKTQTYLPWDSWQHPYVLSQPTVWFHEVFRNDGTPYRKHETELIHRLTGRGTPVASTN